MRRCEGVELAGKKLISPFLASLGRVEDTNRFRNRVDAQRYWGDYLIDNGHETVVWEVKTEREYTGNLYLESFSNAHPGPHQRPGWLVTSHADRLAIVFLDRRIAMILDRKKLQDWFIGGSMYGEYPARPPRDPQRNLTLGYLVPWRKIPHPDVLLCCLHFHESGEWETLAAESLAKFAPEFLPV